MYYIYHTTAQHLYFSFSLHCFFPFLARKLYIHVRMSSRILQPLSRPTRPQRTAIKRHVQRTLRNVVDLPVDADAGPGLGLRPHREADGVVAPIVQHARRHGEHDLVADVRVEPAVLVPVDEQLRAECLR